MPVPECLPTRAHLATLVGLPIQARPPALARKRLHHLRRLRPSKYELLTDRLSANQVANLCIEPSVHGRIAAYRLNRHSCPAGLL